MIKLFAHIVSRYNSAPIAVKLYINIPSKPPFAKGRLSYWILARKVLPVSMIKLFAHIVSQPNLKFNRLNGTQKYRDSL